MNANPLEHVALYLSSRLLLLAFAYLLGCSAPSYGLDADATSDDATPADVPRSESLQTPGPEHRGQVPEGASPARVLSTTTAALVPERSPFLDAHHVRDITAHGDQLAVATRGGLLLYRGTQMARSFDASSGLRSNHVRALLSDGDTLWIAAAEGGCQRLQGDTFSPCPAHLESLRIVDWLVHDTATFALTWTGDLVDVTPGRSPLRTSLHATHRVLSCGGRIWVASRGDGLAFFDHTRWTSTSGPRLIDDLVCLDGDVVVAGPEGVHRYAGDTFVPLGPKTHVRGLGLFDGGLWFGTTSAELVGEAATHHLSGVATQFAALDGRLWAGGDHLLAFLEDGALTTLELPGPGDADIATLAASSSTIALGFFRAGLALWEGGTWRRATVANGLPSDHVNTLLYLDETLWIGTSGGLARRRPGGLVTPVQVPELGCSHINHLATADSRLVVATSCGVALLDHLDEDSPSLAAWYGRDSGLPSALVYTVAVWRGLLVAGTADGLALRPLDAPVETPWSIVRAAPGELRDNWITALSPEEDALVVGTYSGGLHRLVAPDTIEPLPLGARYINPNAMWSGPSGVLVGGLSEGAFQTRRGATLPLPSHCAPGDDVTGFAQHGRQVLVATRTGAAWLPDGCLADDPQLELASVSASPSGVSGTSSGIAERK